MCVLTELESSMLSLSLPLTLSHVVIFLKATFLPDTSETILLLAY